MQITLKDLVKKYGDLVAVDVPHLEIPTGQVVGLVGNNGAGKTTLLRLVLDLVQATQGHVLLGGERVDKTTDWKSHTGSYLDEGFLIDFLNAEEYFSFVGKAYGLSLQEIEEAESRYAKLFTEEVLGTGKLIRDLSAGNRKKVGLLAALLVKPAVLLLDEPFANLDPTSQYVLQQILAEVSTETNATIFVSSHDLGHVTDACERILLMNQGRIERDELISEQTLKELERFFARSVAV